MSPDVKATNANRALYNRLKSKYTGKNVIITDAYLLLMKTLQGSISVVQFDCLINQGTMKANEVRLNMTDKFCVRDWSLMIQKAGASVAATAAEIAVSVPKTYPNPAVFTGAEAANLEAVYNGNLAVKIDSVQYYQNYPVRNFYRVPVSQKGTTSAAIAGPILYPIATDGWDNGNYPFLPVTPSFELNGLGKNELSLTLPAPTTTSGVSSENFATLLLRGFLIQNVNQ